MLLGQLFLQITQRGRKINWQYVKWIYREQCQVYSETAWEIFDEFEAAIVDKSKPTRGTFCSPDLTPAMPEVVANTYRTKFGNIIL